MNERANSIDGVAKTISEILKDKKYSIDYYQREYKWEHKQLEELVTDLTAKFRQVHQPGATRRDVGQYPGYYLGSIIISQKGLQPFIVDGQQRLTTLTLLLTYLRRLQSELGTPEVKIDDLIYSESYGEKSFNLDVPDRNACMQGLFDHGEYRPTPDAIESVHTLVARFGEIDVLFPAELKGENLPYFIDWLKDRVQIVQITAYNDDDAYSIFETMNDRGLKLTPADMLKGYLLANIDFGEDRESANRIWRQRMRELEDLEEGASSDFLKTWLRSQYAKRIRPRRKNARPEDWDRIGTEFHRWLRNHAREIGLESPEDYREFVTRDLIFYSHQYERIIQAQRSFDPTSPLRFVRFNADHRFTLQNQMLLAPLRTDDDPQVVDVKMELVGRFIDILLAWRLWNFRSIDYSTMQYAMATLMFRIQGADIDSLARILHEYLMGQEETFDSRDTLFVHQQNRGHLHRLIARLTDFVTVSSGQPSNYVELSGGSGVKHEVEHIWANHPERHSAEFAHDADFQHHRNRVGDLLILPKQHNGSYNDDTYEQKRPRYYSQNLLAASLDPQTYEKNPGFLRFMRQTGLPFRPYDEFTAQSIEERGILYREIAKLMWDPEDLLRLAERGR